MNPDHEAELVALRLSNPDAWTLIEFAREAERHKHPSGISAAVVTAPSDVAWQLYSDWSRFPHITPDTMVIAACFAAWSYEDLS